MPLGAVVGLGSGDIVLDGDPAPQRKGAQQLPHFSAHVCCAQTAGWIRIPLGMEVGLGPGHIVLDGDPAPQRKGAQQPPLFGPLYSCKAFLSLSIKRQTAVVNIQRRQFSRCS